MNDSPYDPQRPNASHDESKDTARDPVDPQGVIGPPPPPPPYPSAWGQPPKEKRGLFGSLGKAMTALSIAAALFFAGYYVALFAILGDGGSVSAKVYQGGEGDEKIAIIPVAGMIVPESAEFVHHAVQEVMADPMVKAVVLYVDSPGGLVGPSEQIYHELDRLKQKTGLPIIASFGSIAASGGYYVACQADYIFAQPACITGSIGVIAQAMTFEQLLKDNGIQPIVRAARTSPDKTLANTYFQSWGERDFEALEKMLNKMHDRFRAVVRAGRGEAMSDEQFEQATTGQVYLTDEAVALKLIDAEGYLDDAIALARERAGIAAKNPPVVQYAPRVGLLDTIIGATRNSGGLSLNSELTGDSLRRIMMELGTPRAMYWYQP